jgi:hypothetical protein
MSAALKQLMLDLITGTNGVRSQVLLRHRRPERGTKDGGVCLSVETHCREARDLFQEAIREWPAGISAGYPVRAPASFVHTNDDALSRAIWAYDALPHWEGEYGESRKEMCRWVITWLDQRGEQVHAKPVL